MAEADYWMAARAIVMRRDGPRCVYCRVPTAATIEHVAARSKKGGNHLDNLRLACPLCNSRKGDEPLESWLARRGWVLPAPPQLAGSVSQMIRDHYDPHYRGGVFWTGSTNARLRVGDDGVCVLEIRPGKVHPWTRLVLGREDHPRVVLAAYDYCRRHNARRAKPARKKTVAR